MTHIRTSWLVIAAIGILLLGVVLGMQLGRSTPRTPGSLVTDDSEQIITDPTGESVACTLEARICPDGSSVGRVPPACEFAPCGSTPYPTQDTSQPGMIPGEDCVGDRGPCPQSDAGPGASIDDSVCTLDALICPDGSSVGRVGPRCEFAPCPSTKK